MRKGCLPHDAALGGGYPGQLEQKPGTVSETVTLVLETWTPLIVLSKKAQLFSALRLSFLEGSGRFSLYFGPVFRMSRSLHEGRKND